MGADGTALYPNYPKLIGDRYAAPYCLLDGTIAFVLEDQHGVAGYVLAAVDTDRFNKVFCDTWLPEARERYPKPDAAGLTSEEAALIKELHHPNIVPPGGLVAVYPAHLHIDLVSRAQGHGLGPKMMALVQHTLQQRDVPGVHLGMFASNKRARRVYDKLGWKELCRSGDGDEIVYLGLSIAAKET